MNDHSFVEKKTARFYAEEVVGSVLVIAGLFLSFRQAIVCEVDIRFNGHKTKNKTPYRFQAGA